MLSKPSVLNLTHHPLCSAPKTPIFMVRCQAMLPSWSDNDRLMVPDGHPRRLVHRTPLAHLECRNGLAPDGERHYFETAFVHRVGRPSQSPAPASEPGISQDAKSPSFRQQAALLPVFRKLGCALRNSGIFLSDRAFISHPTAERVRAHLANILSRIRHPPPRFHYRCGPMTPLSRIKLRLSNPVQRS